MTSLYFSRQAGAALVVAMLVLSLVTVLAVAMATEYGFGIKRINNQLIFHQAYSYLRAMEAIAHKGLSVDLELDKEEGLAVDRCSDVWALPEQVFQVADDGMFQSGAYGGQIFDLQGRFNLNSLARLPVLTIGEARPEIPFNQAQGMFIRLLQAVGDEDYPVTEYQAREITQAVVDWLDSDSFLSGFNCGEDDSYAGIENRAPHRAANTAFHSLSELRLICNLPYEIYLRLLPHVTVWPVSGDMPINLNTATLPVLRSILVNTSSAAILKKIKDPDKTNYQAPPPLSEQEVEAVRERQRAVIGEEISPFPKAVGFTQLSEVSNNMSGIELWPGANIGLSSEYFMLASAVQLGHLSQRMNSVISREGGTISIINRSMAAYKPPYTSVCFE